MLAGLTLLKYEFLLSLGWDPLRAPTFDWPSGLALGPLGGLMTATFILCGAAMAVFALGLGSNLQNNTGKLGAALMVLAGLALAGLAFTTDPTLRSTPATWHGRLHDASFILLGLALIPSMLVLGLAFRFDARWKDLSLYTWVTAALALPAFALKGAAFYVFLLAVLLWSEALAWRLLKSA
jgi:hypothetical protein